MTDHVQAPIVAYADGHDCAASPPASVGGEGGQVVVGWMPEHREWLAVPVRGWALMGGYALGAPIAEGRLRYLPTRLSAVPHVLATLQPEIVVIRAVRRGAELAYGRSVGWAPAAAAVAAPPITCEISRTVTAHRPMTAPPTVEAGAADRAIAEHVVSLLPPEATLQFGPGGIADVVVRTIDTPVGVCRGSSPMRWPRSGHGVCCAHLRSAHTRTAASPSVTCVAREARA